MQRVGSYRLPRWLSGKESACQCRTHGFDPWVRKIPWRRQWQPTKVFLPGKSHGQRSPADYTPRGLQRAGHELATTNNMWDLSSTTRDWTCSPALEAWSLIMGGQGSPSTLVSERTMVPSKWPSYTQHSAVRTENWCLSLTQASLALFSGLSLGPL